MKAQATAPRSRRAIEEAARRIVTASCREQRVPVKVNDPVVVGKVAALLRRDP